MPEEYTVEETIKPVQPQIPKPLASARPSKEFAAKQNIKSVHLQTPKPLGRTSQSLVLMTAGESRRHPYGMAVCLSAAIGMSHTLIGAVLISVVLQSVSIRDFHALIFTTAYHFCAAEGILGLSFINGWSTPMRKTHRQYAHVVLQTCTVTLAIAGVIVITLPKIIASRSIHGLSGLITLVLTGMCWSVGPFLMSWVVGPFVLRGVRPLHIIHKIAGLACFFMSTVCLCSGIFTSDFSKWAGKDVVAVLLSFIIFYTFIIIYTSSLKYVKMMI